MHLHYTHVPWWEVSQSLGHEATVQTRLAAPRRIAKGTSAVLPGGPVNYEVMRSHSSEPGPPVRSLQGSQEPVISLKNRFIQQWIGIQH